MTSIIVIIFLEESYFKAKLTLTGLVLERKSPKLKNFISLLFHEEKNHEI